MEAGYVPEWGIPIATAHNQVLQDLRHSDVDWTYFSPAAFFEPGERTGKFRLGKDDLIADASGKSHISMEDYAIATVDELRSRRTVASASPSAINSFSNVQGARRQEAVLI